MSTIPYFSENEQTPAQRWDTVRFALGVSASAGGEASPEAVQLYERYIMGEIDLEYIGTETRRRYPQYPSNDPYAGRWTPNLTVAPAQPLETSPSHSHDSTDESDPEQSAEMYVVQLRTLVQEIAEYVAEQPPYQPYLYLDV